MMGLPRVGGDRPCAARATTSPPKAPPRGRGSTRAQRGRAGGAAGSPAWAGIDPATGSSSGSRCWLPRVGGDRPVDLFDSFKLKLAPPRGRGSTQHRDQRRRPRGGSPAWAGIDPRTSAPPTSTRRLPRVGGDRPRAESTTRATRPAPPRGRGSTLGERRRGRHHRGSPAWAGIDPARRPSTWAATRLPRVGGDRPWAARDPRGEGGAPPRGRGSTHGTVRGRVDGGGSPAWAGIDPSLASAFYVGDGLPRVGGDRPERYLRAVHSDAAPPRGRGSTPRTLAAPPR